MLVVTVKNAWAHKRRLLGTFIAVMLGVAFLTGTLVLSDTLRANFGSLFSRATAGTDAVVRSATQVDPGRGSIQRGLIDGGLVARVRAVPGVQAAEPYVEGYGQIIGKNGKAIGGNGPPRLAASWVDHPALTPYRLVAGRAPRTDHEVVINRGAAKDGHLHVGDTTTVEVPDPVPVTVVGLATFGSADGFGRTTYAAFSLSAAERYVSQQPGRISSIPVKAAPGVSQQELVQRIRPTLPAGVEAVTGREVAQENTDQVSRVFLNLVSTFLLLFAVIALLVATFSIYNTFSILVAQRTRESALLRAIGAIRGQIVGSVAGEAALLGAVASVAGLVGGLGIAGLLKGVFNSFGFALPASGLVLRTSTIILGLGVGLVITLVSGLGPAVKASRVSPLAALRDVAVEPSAASLRRVIAGVAITVTGVAVVLVAVSRSGKGVLAATGLGALLTMLGIVALGPVVATPASAILGTPLRRLRGVSGALARQNAMRNPRRTSSTAAALMVGVGVVTLFTVFAASLKASVNDSVGRSLRADLVISSPSFGGGRLSPQLATAAAGVHGVQQATGLGQGVVTIAGSGQRVAVADPASLASVLDLDVIQGSIQNLSAQGAQGAQALAVSRPKAASNGWHVGERVPVTFLDGTTTRLQIGAIYKATDVAGDFLLNRVTYTPHSVQTADSVVLIKLRPGADLTASRSALQRVAQQYGRPTVQDRQAYTSSLTTNVNALLGLVYVMLALAIVIALMGIANSLSLSIHERIRELGLLRAVGETRSQVRSMVRWESVIIAVFGTVGGLGLGVFLGWALVRAASTSRGIGSFAAPPSQLLLVLSAGAVAGVVAGLRPARRAARLELVHALAAE